MIIRVEPSLLQGLAAKMQDVGEGVSALGSSAASAAQGAPSYDGQFGPLVWPIGSEASSRTLTFTTHLVNLSDRLGRKAFEFERADHTTINGLISTSITWPAMAKFLAKWSKMTGIPVATLERYLKLGTLFGGPSLNSLLLGMVLGNNLFSWTGQTFMGMQRPSWWPSWLGWYGGTQPQTTSPQPSPSQPSNINVDKKQPPDQSINGESTNKYPQPIHLNNNIEPTKNGSCAVYAQQRRPDLGKTADPQGASNDQGAYNYKFKEGSFQLSNNDTNDLRETIAPGYALVWDKTTPGANPTYGHVAIIEEVHSDYIIVSHSGWSEGTSTKFSREYIESKKLFIIP
jgi:surface antigen